MQTPPVLPKTTGGYYLDETPLVLINYLVVNFSHLKTTGCFIHNAGLDLNLCEIHLWYQEQPVDIIWSKTPLVLMNFVVVMLPVLKLSVFNRNMGLDFNCVKSTHEKKQPGGIIWLITQWLFFPLYNTACFLDNTIGCKLCVTHQLYQKQPVRIILDKT